VCSSKPEILPVIQTCIPTVFPVHPGHLSPKSKKNRNVSRKVCSKCIPSVFQVYSKCIPNVFQVYSKCVPSVFHKFKCVPTVFPKLIPNVFIPIRVMYSQVYSQEDMHSELAVQFGAGLRQFANTSWIQCWFWTMFQGTFWRYKLNTAGIQNKSFYWLPIYGWSGSCNLRACMYPRKSVFQSGRPAGFSSPLSSSIESK
jgi:hypothetical protein